CQRSFCFCRTRAVQCSHYRASCRNAISGIHDYISVSRRRTSNTNGTLMAQCIYLFAGPSDNRALSEYVLSLDLRMYPILIQQPEFSVADDPVAYPFSFLSPTKREHLHPYGNPLRISDATDPLIELMRPYLKDNTLVIGRLYCSDDVKTF